MDRRIQSALTQASITIEGGKNNKLTNVLIKESVKDHVFPVAKFLYLVKLPQPHKEKKTTLGALRWRDGATFQQT